MASCRALVNYVPKYKAYPKASAKPWSRCLRMSGIMRRFAVRKIHSGVVWQRIGRGQV